MQTFPLCSVLRCMALLVLLWTGGRAAAQSAADQQLKALPQTVKDNGENRVVTKTNTTSTNAMNKLDSAGNKAFKSFTGMFKKKNKPRKPDSAATRPPETTQTPRSSSSIQHLNVINEKIIYYETFGISPRNPFVLFHRRRSAV